MTYDLNYIEQIKHEELHKKLQKYLQGLPEDESIPIKFGVTNDNFVNWLIRNRNDLIKLLW